MIENSDDELMARGAAGDRDALRQLVERWEDRVFAFTAKMTGSQEEAQDLTQDVFVLICRNVHRYRASGQFKSWLYRIAGNVVRSRIRRKRILKWVHFDGTVHDSVSPSKTIETALEEQERKRAIRSSLLELPERQRQAVVLRYFENMKNQEAADAMGVSVSAVESLLHRALEKLKQHIVLRKEAGE